MKSLAQATCLLVLGSIFAASPAGAYDELVKKNVFEMPSYTTLGGKTIRNVRIGWEAYGKLSPNKDNVILITHFFSGDSHAAGKYKPEDAAPGYWNAIIGPDKPIDTNKYYVISSDTLVNLSVKNPNVITTGPATLDPDTGKPYGMSFPIVTIRDFVNVQKALLDSLGITRLEAVMGASMGALQAIEWATAYPDMVKRVIPVIGAGEIDGWSAGWLDIWASPIRLDPNWNKGDYYGRAEPTAGLALDSKRAQIVMDLLRKLAIEQDAAIIAVTHDEKIFDRFDRIFELRDGWLEAHGNGRSGWVDSGAAIRSARDPNHGPHPK